MSILEGPAGIIFAYFATKVGIISKRPAQIDIFIRFAAHFKPYSTSSITIKTKLL